ncbi:MAG TPA: hypothetical protein VEY92_11460 [Pseudoxanthomonas sp.]|nr:hypothetical protein [Pseudoxanthomonas sp.]
MNNNIFVPKNEWERCFKGWFITECKLRTERLVYLLARELIPTESISETEDHEIGVRMLEIHLVEPEGQRKTPMNNARGYNMPVAGVCRKPIAQELLLSSNSDGAGFARGGGKQGREFATGIVPKRIKCLDGYAYAVGTSRDILKRVNVGRWEPFNRKGFPAEQTSFRTTREAIKYGTAMGFNDIDGPNESLLYAVGGKGDVWRYDGHRWQQCDFPSNEQLGTVTVAGDGNVYITGEGGNLWVGEKDNWRLIEPGGSSVLYNDTVWYRGELWLCSDYQLRVLRDGKLERPKFDGQDLYMTGHMDAYGDLLLIGGGGSAWLFDGEQWRCLVAPYE